MNKLRKLNWLTAWAAAVSILAGGASWGAETSVSGGPAAGAVASNPIPDVALGPGGVFRGQIVNAQGAATVAGQVFLVQNGREAASAAIDQRGSFEFSGLRGGMYDLTTTTGSATPVRLWTADAAPPSARQGLLVIADGDVTSGQNSGSPVWRTLTNPWISAGLITAAIATPIALSNDKSGS